MSLLSGWTALMTTRLPAEIGANVDNDFTMD